MGRGGQHAPNEVRQQSVASRTERPFRHRRRAPPSPAAGSGLDSPPSATYPSLSHRPCSLSIRTSQHLCTLVHPNYNDSEEVIPAGVAPCAPLVAFGRFVVSATNDGRLCFYTIERDHNPRRPLVTVDVDPQSTLTGLVAAPKGTSLVRYRSTLDKERTLDPPSFLGHLVAITSGGDVHIIECSDCNLVKKLFSWNTRTCNPSCVTVRPDRNGQWRISLGYQSGSVEEWQVSIPVKEQPSTRKGPITTEDDDKTNKQGTNETDQRAYESEWMPLMRRAYPKVLFRGFFQLPVRSLTSLGFDPTEKDDRDTHILRGEVQSRHQEDVMETQESTLQMNSAKEAAVHHTINTDNDSEMSMPELSRNDRRDYLAVCLMMDQRTLDGSLGRPASSSQIEVIQVSRLEQEYTARLDEVNEHGDTVGPKAVAFALENYCVWPSIGMEILDTASLSVNDAEGQRRLSPRIRALQSQGSDRMCTHDGTNPFFATALSDGTIARISATFEGSMLCWGVSNDLDQVTLSYPAIGIAPVDYDDTGTYVACCLRGGTVYMLPQNAETEQATVFLSPVETEKERSTQYLQGFTAGNVSVMGIPSARTSALPVLIYSSSEGVLNAYTCAFLTRTEEDAVLQELVDNGAVQLLRGYLCSLHDGDPHLSSVSWRRSRDEMMSTLGDPLTFEIVSSSSFVYSRHLLMTLAGKESAGSL